MLCQRIGGEIINADAFQLYQGLDLCTAKPTADEQRTTAHHLYSLLGPAESCDAQRFHDLATPAIEEVLSRRRWPVIVGGSGLYVKSLTHGLAPLPKGDDTMRTRLGQMTPEERIAELLRLDPAAETNVPFSNDRYVSRALEICILTGQPQSELRQSWRDNQPEFMGVLLGREREDLYDRINRRVVSMIQGGAVEEVQALLLETTGMDKNVVGTSVPTDSEAGTGLKSRPRSANDPAVYPLPDFGVFKAIGVKQIHAYLHGECSLDQTIADIQQATRRYAKRQATWFKRETGFQTVCLSSDSTAQLAVERILELFPCLLQPPSSAPSLST